LHRAQNASLVETNLSWQHQACKKNNARSFGRAESRSDPIHDVRSKNLAYQNESNQNKTHHRDHGGKNSPAFFFPLLRRVLRKDRNECDAQGTAGNQIIQKIRQRERGVVRIRHRV